MALVVKDRVKETTTSTGTGTITLAGATQGYQPFSVIGDGNTTYYTITNGTDWEVGIGTYTATGTTLSRDTILESSNSGSAVNFSAGVKDVFVTYPAEKAVTLDGTETLTNKTINGSNNTITNVSLTTGVTGTLPVSKGGTGATSLTSGYVLKGNGTSAVSASVIYDNGTNVGIGTSSPAEKLNISGSGTQRIRVTETGSGAYGQFTQSTTNVGIIAAHASSDNYINFNTTSSGATAERMRIDSSGYLLVNRTSRSSSVSGVRVETEGRYGSTVTGSAGYSFGTNGTSFTINDYSNGSTETERMRITSAGSVGIGTTNPVKKLELVSDTSETAQLIVSSDTGTSALYLGGTSDSIKVGIALNNNDNSLQFRGYNNTERMRIDSSGNVGIGTSSPAQLLHVQSTSGAAGSAVARLAVSGTAALEAGQEFFSTPTDSTSSLRSGRIYSKFDGVAYTDARLSFQSMTTGNTLVDTMHLKGGNVGIGTSSPGAKLHVNGVARVDSYINLGNNGYIRADAAGELRFQGGSTATTFYNSSNSAERMRIDSSGNVLINRSSTSGLGKLNVEGGADFTNGNVLLCRDTGNVGIGTSSPAEKLTVSSGHISLSANYDIKSPDGFAIHDTSAALDRFTFSTSSIYAARTGGNHIFNTASTERMRIDSNGNVGIGTSSPGARVDLGYTGGSVALRVSRDASNRLDFYQGGGVSYIDSSPAGAQLAFSTVGSERMRIDSSGRVGIGTSSPSQTLQVQGTGYATSDFRAPIFYDSANTAFYLDPTGSTSLNAAGSLIASGNLTLNNGADRRVRLGSSTNYFYDLQTTGDNFQIIEAGTTPRLTISYPSGAVTAATDFRAPIFYDSSDTGYYLDPNATANNALRIRGGTLHGPNPTWGAYLAVGTDGHWSSSYASVATTNGNLHLDAATGSDIYLNNYAGNQTYVRYAGANRLAVYGPSNYTEATGSLRAPIFYDSNNTGYYANPASTSVFSALDLADRLRTETPTAYTAVTSLTADTAPIRVPEVNVGTTASFLPALGQTSIYTSGYRQHLVLGNYRTASAWNGGMFVALGGNDSYATEYFLLNYGGSISHSNGYVKIDGSARAPIFYDSDNTAFYLDTDGSNWQLQTPSGYIRIGPRNTGYCHFNTDRARYYFDKEVQFDSGINDYSGNWQLNDSLGQHNSSLRAPIFYDSNNTGTYLDPNGSSVLNVVYAQQYLWASDGNYGTVGATIYCDTVNSGYDSDPLELCYVRGSEVRVGAGGGTKPIVAGTYARPSAHTGYLDGRYGSVSSNGTVNPIYCISTSYAPTSSTALGSMYGIGYTDGATSGVWSGGGWGMYAVANGTVRHFLDAANGIGYATDSYRAPRFYDSNNTAFYFDGASTTNINTLAGNGKEIFNTGDSYLRINQSAAFASGIWIGSSHFAQASDKYASFGSNGGTTNSRVYIYGGTYNGANAIAIDGANSRITAQGDIRAPIFYDSNNTAYYLDASSTGTSLNVAGSIVAAGNVTAYSDIRVKDNVEQIGGALERLQAIRGVTYTRNDLEDKERRYAGVIAQEIEEVLPEAVFDNGDRKAVDYNATIGLLIEAIKELKAEVETLKKG